MAGKKPRSPERARAVVDRASRMQAFKPSIWDRNPFDPQMKTPGRGAAPFAGVDFLGPEHVVSRGVQDVPLNRITTHQQTVSPAVVKRKINELAAGKQLAPGQVLKIGDTYHSLDGNHGVTARRALGQATTKATVLELRSGVGQAGAKIGTVPVRPAVAATRTAAAGRTMATAATRAVPRVPMRGGGVGLAIGVAAAAASAYAAYRSSQPAKDAGGGRGGPGSGGTPNPPPQNAGKPQRSSDASGRNSYTTVTGKATTGTKAQIAAWQKRRGANASA